MSRRRRQQLRRSRLNRAHPNPSYFAERDRLRVEAWEAAECIAGEARCAADRVRAEAIFSEALRKWSHEHHPKLYAGES